MAEVFTTYRRKKNRNRILVRNYFQALGLDGKITFKWGLNKLA